MKLLLLPTAVIAAVYCSNPALQNSVKTNQVRYVYLEPADTEHRWIYNQLREWRLLENVSEFLSPLRLPRPDVETPRLRWSHQCLLFE
jgi:hypothetical protein